MSNSCAGCEADNWYVFLRLSSPPSFNFPLEQDIPNTASIKNAPGQVLPQWTMEAVYNTPEKQQMLCHSGKEGDDGEYEKDNVDARTRIDTEMIFNGFCSGIILLEK